MHVSDSLGEHVGARPAVVAADELASLHTQARPRRARPADERVGQKSGQMFLCATSRIFAALARPWPSGWVGLLHRLLV